MDIKIEAADVNRLLADAILKSSIGEVVDSMVKKVVGELTKSYNNPLETTILSMIQEMVRKTLYEKHADDIQARVAEQLAEKLTNEFIDRVVESAASRYR